LLIFFSLAQATLASPLTIATQEARSTFLKSEAFRLLSLLFAKVGTGASALEEAAATSLSRLREPYLAGIQNALQDEEMLKAKRVRVVLKALEKFVSCLSAPCSTEALTSLEAVKNQVFALGDSGKYAANVQAAITKLVGDMDSKASELKEKVAEQKTVQLESGTPSSQTKKGKNKKKKNKKR
jgi:hypothetical protein